MNTGNIKTEVKGGILTIIVDLNKELGVSKSGKSMIIATTSGNVEIVPGVIAGINIYKKIR
jgi:hypothetical protein